MKSFEKIYNENYEKFFRYFLSKIRNYEDSEELVNTMFIKVSKHLANFDSSKSSVTTWLYTIANNLIIDYWRSNKNKYTTISISSYLNEDGDEIIQLENINPDSNNIENVELKKLIEQAFNKLKPNYRKFAQLFFIEQKKYEEIADILQVPIGTVKGMINRCREQLMNELKNCYIN